jgi:hypothetical protein
MRRAFPPLLIVAITAVVGILSFGRSSAPARDEVWPPARRLPVPGKQLQGVASCASAACHHGNGPRGSQGSEYTTWFGYDPHARAYTILFDPRSLLIEKNLKGLTDIQQAKPHEDILCLNCHVQPDFAEQSRSERFASQDGVGCESCHGAAERWLSVHYTWGGRTEGEKRVLRRDSGMTETKDVLVRAQVCVVCHVGRGEGDVNHDLIAAGHPRLRFEYGAYLANYPRHWKEQDDKARYPDFEARAWLLGQVVSAQAALELLKYRAEVRSKPWPEFAEYGCFECHHDLRDPSWRQERGSSGGLAWGTWYFSLLPLLAKQTPEGEPPDLGRLAVVKQSMSQPFLDRRIPNRTRVAADAGAAGKALSDWLGDLECKRWDNETTLRNLLGSLALDDRVMAEAGWDGAVQLYLGLAATHHALSDLKKLGLPCPPREAIRAIARTLLQASPQGERGKYDSPVDFRPVLFKADLGHLLDQLRPAAPK